jgi:hypothetical protein
LNADGSFFHTEKGRADHDVRWRTDNAPDEQMLGAQPSGDTQGDITRSAGVRCDSGVVPRGNHGSCVNGLHCAIVCQLRCEQVDHALPEKGERRISS